jgi:hypothetical protein
MKTAKGFLGFLLFCCLVLPVFPQGERGKADLTVSGGAISIDYGRPSLQGRDMLAKLQVGSAWRMGMNQATTLTTPVDLVFGSVNIAKGSYSLFLLKTGADSYQLVFNSQTGQWGTQHDASKDVAKVDMKKGELPAPVETFTIELKSSTGGGTFVMTWGTLELSVPFKAS